MKSMIGFASVTSFLAMAICAHPASAQDKAGLAIERYSCRDILRESGTDRDVAVAFMHGYILGKAGITTLNVEALLKQTTAFIERCLDNPKESAIATMLTTANGAPNKPANAPK